MSLMQALTLVLLVHAAIDRIKQGRKDTIKAFVIDQAAHVLSLVVLAWLLVALSILPGYTGVGYGLIVAVGGFTATVQASGILVGRLAQRLLEENQLRLGGLQNGGKFIGQLGRAPIFLFIFTGQAAGIGFLVAGQSKVARVRVGLAARAG